MDTLQSPYFEGMVGSVSLDSAYLVTIEERIESRLKSETIQDASSNHDIKIESLVVYNRKRMMKLTQLW